MPKYEIVYTEMRTRTVVVIAPDEAEAYDFFHNDFCAPFDNDPSEFELVGEDMDLRRDGWRYYDEDTKITEVVEVKDD